MKLYKHKPTMENHWKYGFVQMFLTTSVSLHGIVFFFDNLLVGIAKPNLYWAVTDLFYHIIISLIIGNYDRTDPTRLLGYQGQIL